MRPDNKNVGAILTLRSWDEKSVFGRLNDCTNFCT